MARYERFEDVPVWQLARALYGAVLDLLESERLPVSYAYRNQLERAALSVATNIAEGFERTTTRELCHLLGVARASAGEVRSLIAVVLDRPRLALVRSDLAAIRGQAESCGRQLSAWIRSVRQGPVQGVRRLAERP